MPEQTAYNGALSTEDLLTQVTAVKVKQSVDVTHNTLVCAIALDGGASRGTHTVCTWCR